MGYPSIGVVLAEAAIGWLLVELLMAGWHRVPFTCSYMPGKGFVPHMFVKAFASYVFFIAVTGVVLRESHQQPRLGFIVALGVVAVAGLLGLRRARVAREAPLLFEDELPSDITPLRLNAD
jgi:hypothetical protein